MEPKFRLSPMIDSFVSQRLEDKNRDRLKKQTENMNKEKLRGTAREKENDHVKMGQPVQKHEQQKKVAFVEPDPERSRAIESRKETFLRSKAMPYVDVPPVRTTVRAPSMIDPVKGNQSSKNETVYKSRAPVEFDIDIEKLVEKVLDLEINIPLRSLAGVSGAVQKEIRKQVTKTRQPVETAVKVNLLEEGEEKHLVRVETLPTEPHKITEDMSDDIPKGYMVADDPILQYLSEHKEAEPEDLVVAKPSESLRAIYTTINHVGQEECILDGGSMIVSMSRETAVQSGLNWDPNIRINMESASNHVEKTLGLARNVRFAVGGLNLFLQVHILDNPPYRVLLGRPFETLTSAIIKTKIDGSSEIVLTDPNSKEVAVVPTYKRGVGPDDLQKQRYQAF